jgi:hypothetical protein
LPGFCGDFWFSTGGFGFSGVVFGCSTGFSTDSAFGL